MTYKCNIFRISVSQHFNTASGLIVAILDPSAALFHAGVN